MRNQRQLLLAPVALASIFLVVSTARAAINNADYTTQIQAADVLSRFLTDLNARADARAQALAAFLRETGASHEYTHQRKPFEHPKSEEFERVYAGAIQYIKDGGEKDADPDLPKLETNKLVNELRVLMAYDTQQFLTLDMQQKEIRSITSFLDSTERTAAYREWAAKKNQDQQPPEMAALPPAPAADATAFAKAMKEHITLAQDEAWKQAQAKGLTRAQFDKEWARRQQQARRLIGFRLAALRNSMQPQQQPEPNRVATNAAPLPPQLNAPIVDPRWSAYYYGPTDAWGWGDNFSDAFTFRSGSGSYRRYDQRLNRAFDLRIDGTYDERVNVDNDRRLNIHQDPREGI
jgi:hypothetical protein